MKLDKLEALRRYKILTFIHNSDNPTCCSLSPNVAHVQFINGLINVENGLLISQKYFDKEEEAKQYYLQEIEKQVEVKGIDSSWIYITLVDSHYPISRIPFSTNEIMESYMVVSTNSINE